MDKYRRAFESADASDQNDAAMAAESVRTDFSDLVSMLNQQLANLADTDKLAQSHLLEAKAAAERGLMLSMQLIDLLRAET